MTVKPYLRTISPDTGFKSANQIPVLLLALYVQKNVIKGLAYIPPVLNKILMAAEPRCTELKHRRSFYRDLWMRLTSRTHMCKPVR